MIEHLEAYFADFGVAVTVGGVACRGIFDASYQDSFGIAGSAPRLTVSAADLPAVAQGQAVSLPAGAYVVRAIEPDGTGLLVLILEAA